MSVKRIILAIVAVVVAVIVLAMVFGNKPEVTPGTDDNSAPTTNAAQAVTPSAKSVVKMTEGQEQAVGKAQDYLSFTNFSKVKLQAQLVQFDKFSPADAKFAVNHVTVDWQEQAVKAAQTYLSFTHFSRAGLQNQLVQFDRFPAYDAQVAVKKAFESADN